MEAIFMILLVTVGITAAILALIFVVTPLFKGIGYLVGGVFRLIGWLIMHVFEYVSGTLGDVVRFVGAIIAMVILLPMAPLNVIIGRWSAAAHFADSIKREFKVAALCLYRIGLRRPLKLVLLHGLLEGVEERGARHGARGEQNGRGRWRTQADAFMVGELAREIVSSVF